MLAELDDEYERVPRLHTKFSWVNESEYRANRTKRLTLSRKQQRERQTAFDFIWDHVQTTLPGPSRIDALHLSYGLVLGIPVVTDDTDMRALATAFDVKAMKTLELVRLMFDSGHIDIAKVRSIAAYWSYEADRPKDFASDYRQLFNEAAPP